MGTARLTPDRRHRLTALAERDRCIVSAGSEDTIIRNDEHHRTRLRALLIEGTHG
ncbi:hypothetical protein [Kitasatospora aureofaciens]|uniref:hypothetical protein n=1 Tax=Kitasatospora aureofaciens TaxID=1894 RepID=UPI0038025AD8